MSNEVEERQRTQGFTEGKHRKSRLVHDLGVAAANLTAAVIVDFSAAAVEDLFRQSRKLKRRSNIGKTSFEEVVILFQGDNVPNRGQPRSTVQSKGISLADVVRELDWKHAGLEGVNGIRNGAGRALSREGIIAVLRVVTRRKS